MFGNAPSCYLKCDSMHACMLSHFSHIWLFASSRTVARQASLSMGICQARILEWDAMSSSRVSYQPRDWIPISYVSCIGRWFYSFLPKVSGVFLNPKPLLSKKCLYNWRMWDRISHFPKSMAKAKIFFKILGKSKVNFVPILWNLSTLSKGPVISVPLTQPELLMSSRTQCPWNCAPNT